VSVVARKRHF